MTVKPPDQDNVFHHNRSALQLLRLDVSPLRDYLRTRVELEVSMARPERCQRLEGSRERGHMLNELEFVSPKSESQRVQQLESS